MQMRVAAVGGVVLVVCMLERALAQLQGETGTLRPPGNPSPRPSTPGGQVSTPLRGGIGGLTTRPSDYPRHVPTTRYNGGGHHPSTPYNGGQLEGGIGSLTTLPPGYPRYGPTTPYNGGHGRTTPYYPRYGQSTLYNGGHGSRTQYYPRHRTTPRPNGGPFDRYPPYNCTVRGPRRRVPGRPCIGPLCRRRPLPPPRSGRGWPRPMPPPGYPRYGPSTPPNGGHRRPQWRCFGPLCRLLPRPTGTGTPRDHTTPSGRPRRREPLLRRWPFPWPDGDDHSEDPAGGSGLINMQMMSHWCSCVRMHEAEPWNVLLVVDFAIGDKNCMIAAVTTFYDWQNTTRQHACRF